MNPCNTIFARVHTIGCATPKFLCGPNPSLHLLLPLTKKPSTPGPSSLPLEVGPLSTARAFGERCKLPPQPNRKANFVHFCLKIWHLVAPVLFIFLRIDEHTVGGAKCIVAHQPKFWGQPLAPPTVQTPGLSQDRRLWQTRLAFRDPAFIFSYAIYVIK